MKNILCYGDSNTFGSIPIECKRYDINERWTGILQKLLGNEYRIIEEGLGGRTSVFDDPHKSGRNGLEYIETAMETHKPLDLVVIALGTNDLKTHFSASSNIIAQGIRRIIYRIRTCEDQMKYKKPDILVLAPPPLGERVEIVNKFSEFNQNSISISKELAEKYRLLSELENVHFFDLGTIVKASDEDQIHFSKESHKIIAEHLAEKIKEIFRK